MKSILREDDDLVIFCRRVLKNWTSGDPLEIEVKPYSPTRSLGANALFHVWLPMIVKFLNSKEMCMEHKYDVDFIKMVLKRKFGLGMEAITPFSDDVEIHWISTSKYTKEQFHEFLMKIQIWCFDMGLDLPVKASPEYDEYREASQ